MQHWRAETKAELNMLESCKRKAIEEGINEVGSGWWEWIAPIRDSCQLDDDLENAIPP